MAEERKAAKEVTSMEQDFIQWYTDIVRKAELCDYISVKGCMVVQSTGYVIWERIQSLLNQRFKATGARNRYMPLSTPKSLLDKGKDHVEGFTPEVVWVTQDGLELLQERFCVCLTSETLFCDYHAKHVHSYRDLPQVLNQWCSVVRWEKTTHPFLRPREFLWQEGYAVHATEEEIQARTEQMSNLYADFCEQELAIPVVRGQKTDKEKSAGTVAIYMIEFLTHDGKALQNGTSHNFGGGFACTFDMQFQDKDNSLRYAHQISQGMTTRMIGAFIMMHGDDPGLRMPSRIVSVQVTIVPVAMHREDVLKRTKALAVELRAAGVRVNVDDTDRRPDFKFAECEMRGVSLRIELGPKDIKAGSCVLMRHDNDEKSKVALQGTATMVSGMLKTIRKVTSERAEQHRDTHTYNVITMEEFTETAKNRPDSVRAMWCGDQVCRDKIKGETGTASRCIPFAQEKFADRCVCYGKPTKRTVYWSVAY